VSNRLWAFLYGYPNMAGCLLGLAGIGLYFAGFIGRGWLAITAGLYALGWVAAWTLLPEPGAGLAAAARREDLKEELENLVGRSVRLLPAAAGTTLERIRDLTLELLGRLREGQPLFVEQAHHIEQTVRNYLPATLESYLRLPRLYARMHVIKDGRTAEALLQEQLITLEAGLGKLLENVAADDAQALLANGRFLEAKFGHSEGFGVR